MKLLFILIFFPLVLFSQTSVSSEINYIQVPHNTFSLTQILQKSEENKFQQLRENHAKFGFTQDTFWIEIKLHNDSTQKSKQVIELLYPILDYIDIYEYEKNQLILKKELGDLRIFIAHLQTPNPSYSLTLLPQESKRIFIKIRSQGSINIQLNVNSIDQYYKSTILKNTILAFYFGAVCIMLIYNFIIFTMIRNISFLYYVLFHVSYTLFSLIITGVSFQLFWPMYPELNHYILPLSMTLTGVFGLLFVVNFLNIKNKSPKLYKFLQLLIILFILSFVLIFITDYNTTIKIDSLLSIFTSSFLLLVALYIYFKYKDRNALYYFISWSFLFGGIIVIHLSNIGIIPSTIFTNYSSHIGSFIELTLLSIALAHYYSQLKEKHLQLSINNKELEYISNTDNLTSAYNRRYLYNYSETYLSQAKANNSDFSLLMLDLDFFKNVNDTYGHSVGDEVLVNFSKTIQTIIRENDVFVRFGGEEFVLFLPNTDEKNSIEIAKSINKIVREIIFESTKELKISVSIGISSNIYEIDKLLSFADKALYQAKESGRDTYKVFSI